MAVLNLEIEALDDMWGGDLGVTGNGDHMRRLEATNLLVSAQIARSDTEESRDYEICQVSRGFRHRLLSSRKQG